jgi:hypothetical protein
MKNSIALVCGLLCSTLLVLGPVGTVNAQFTVVQDSTNPANATGIRNLEVLNLETQETEIYNVTFRFESGEDVYPGSPPDFDFRGETVFSAMEAVVDALNSVDEVTRVGPEGGGDTVFRIGVVKTPIPEFIVSFTGKYISSWQSEGADADKPAAIATYADFTPAGPPPSQVTIGGNVTGLVGSGLVLQNNGGDDEPIDGDGPFTFDTPLTPSSTYNVTVAVDPSNPDQICSVANGSGTVPDQAVTNVAVTCAPPDTPVADTAFLPGGVYLPLLLNN